MKKAESDLRTINMEKGTLISFMPKGRQIQQVWRSVSIFFFFWYVARLWHDSYYELNWAASKCVCWNPGFQYLMCCCAMLSCPVLSNSLWPEGLQLPRQLCPWDSPGKNSGIGCHALLQGIFSTQELNPGLPHCRQILYQLNYQGSSTVLHAVTLLENMVTEDVKMSSYWRRLSA